MQINIIFLKYIATLKCIASLNVIAFHSSRCVYYVTHLPLWFATSDVKRNYILRVFRLVHRIRLTLATSIWKKSSHPHTVFVVHRERPVFKHVQYHISRSCLTYCSLSSWISKYRQSILAKENVYFIFI